MKGYELCNNLISLHRKPYLPILACIATINMGDVIEMARAEVSEFIFKPFASEDLLGSIKKLLNRGRRRNVLGISSEAGSVLAQFDFPEAVKTPCQQYLLYFVEFLRDIGIDATGSLQERAGRVLFSITPTDKSEALDNIREALDAYLRLPTNHNITPFTSPETGIEVQRLSAQVLHLQSQLMLASAAYQQKDLANKQQTLIIQQQQTLIQQQIASGQVLLASLQQGAEEDDAESLGTDLVKVKAWNPEGLPIQVNLAELLRRFKDKFNLKNKN